MAERGAAVLARLLAAWLAAGCASLPYEPYFVAPPGGLPADAFARCQQLLLVRFGRLLVDDSEGFRLQTGWAPVRGQPGRQRATVFRQGPGIGLLVEASWLDGGWLGGPPTWTEPRADAALERELGQLIESALRDP